MMLRVILQIVPYGDEDSKYEIGRLDIFNMGAVDNNGNHRYGVIDFTKGQEGMFLDSIYHPREDGAWALVYKALDQLNII